MAHQPSDKHKPRVRQGRPNEWTRVHSIPRVIVCDNSVEFGSSEFLKPLVERGPINISAAPRIEAAVGGEQGGDYDDV
jgi:hypothetical protein